MAQVDGYVWAAGVSWRANVSPRDCKIFPVMDKPWGLGQPGLTDVPSSRVTLALKDERRRRAFCFNR